MKNKEFKIETIVKKIRSGVHDINKKYRRGPDLYFYQKLVTKRETAPRIADFLKEKENLELVYTTLLAWDMNSRGAKMKYFTDFKDNLLSNINLFSEIESHLDRGIDIQFLSKKTKDLYLSLDLMSSNGRLVANSKTLHFLFPKFFMPIDRTNTLQYFYGNTNESRHKFAEILSINFKILGKDLNWETQLDMEWNRTKPKIIDNAIMLLTGNSIH